MGGREQAVMVSLIPEGSIRDSEEVRLNTRTGILTTWNYDKGFGFVQPEEGGEQLFCHLSDLQDARLMMHKGDRVTYVPMFDDETGKDFAGLVKLAEWFHDDAETDFRPKQLASDGSELRPLDREALHELAYDPFGGTF